MGKRWGEKPNIIVMVVDALRADHLSCYGYDRITSPNLDIFAKESVLFQSAFSASPSTIASIPSILSGLYPSLHGVGIDGNVVNLSTDISILPEVLKNNGYNTVGFNTNPYMAGNHGYNRGYDSYLDLFTPEKKVEGNKIINKVRKKFTKFRISKSCVCSREVNKRVKKWLKNTKQPFFMWVHYMDVHGKYLPREPFFSEFSKNTARDRIVSFKKNFSNIWAQIYKDPNSLTPKQKELIINCYDSEIKYFDHNFKKFLNLLKKNRLLENTIIVVTADHGEEFWEHGKWGHYMQMYDTNLHVPLLIRYHLLTPEAKKVEKQVQNIDIFPTILDILNIGKQQHLSGLSLLPLIRNGNDFPERVLFFEGGGIKGISVGYYINRLYSLRTSQWKYIKNVTENKRELYSLRCDPLELKNLVSIPEIQEKVREFDFCLSDLLKSRNKLEKKNSSLQMDKDIIERLKHLGYM